MRQIVWKATETAIISNTKLLGVTGENLASEIVADVSALEVLFPNADYAIIAIRPDGIKKPILGIAVPVDGIIRVSIASDVVAVDGDVYMELRAYLGEAIAISLPITMRVVMSDVSEPDPDEVIVPSWVADVLEKSEIVAQGAEIVVEARDETLLARDDAIAAAMSADEDAQSTAADREVVESLSATVQSNKVATDANVATTAALRDETKQYADVAEAYFITRVFAVDDDTGHVIQLASGDADNLAFAIPSNGHMEVTIGA